MYKWARCLQVAKEQVQSNCSPIPFPPPHTMNPLTIVPYSYVPTKVRKAQHSPSFHKQPTTSQSEHLQQRAEMSMPHGNPPKLLIEEVDKLFGVSQASCSMTSNLSL